MSCLSRFFLYFKVSLQKHLVHHPKGHKECGFAEICGLVFSRSQFSVGVSTLRHYIAK